MAVRRDQDDHGGAKEEEEAIHGMAATLGKPSSYVPRCWVPARAHVRHFGTVRLADAPASDTSDGNDNDDDQIDPSSFRLALSLTRSPPLVSTSFALSLPKSVTLIAPRASPSSYPGEPATGSTVTRSEPCWMPSTATKLI
uniref:Uncharacterized protein n=1 Tax=Oryza nivara TaxID=4536 RepID=A0A0E0G488_ORYNI